MMIGRVDIDGSSRELIVRRTTTAITTITVITTAARYLHDCCDTTGIRLEGTQ
ncbi:uncharacterized protein BO97DRAFT_407809 [Aspergillus homomorphus CBS 101889]|uniref:Uncharacterized protein n=1 Tax=Aspergillus homomorphus (strain CBS 101889) TaxID=1450537 RepID=A0A395HMY2_ASPHC|nr:hypothetical protein BO97DRAFT_407809 [Aspergillus homomorphus CBS 101889]RAL09292.1 hypothetical protein BO97DRAFT_407809 [Aspergillus homomorphus CBS 101889]